MMAVLSFGAISGGVGATSVYRACSYSPFSLASLRRAPQLTALTARPPAAINVIRTKLQAAGSTGHPQEYTGFLDVMRQTHAREGWRGFYKGLTVNLAKVIPAVSISYVVRPSGFRAAAVSAGFDARAASADPLAAMGPPRQVYENSKKYLDL